MDLKQLIANPPKLHSSGDRLTAWWRLSDKDLQFLDDRLTQNMKTIETGAGLSTILFALKGTNHICIAPDEELCKRIREYCDQQSISHSNITFLAEKSEYALPRLEGSDFELALIDGRHGFPTPFIDWFYLSNLLEYRLNISG